MAINEKMKWPTDKAKYDRNYLRLYGKRCLLCKGYKDFCEKCNGIGWVEKR